MAPNMLQDPQFGRFAYETLGYYAFDRSARSSSSDIVRALIKTLEMDPKF